VTELAWEDAGSVTKSAERFTANAIVGGIGIGLIGTADYVMDRKGREVGLPAETTIRVRMDNAVTLPRFTVENRERESGKSDAE
jgi:hypothetical protein